MPTRSRLRRLAAHVLVLWVFGLASGIVNACVLGSDSRHAVHAAAAVAVHVHHAGMVMDDMDSHDGHEHPADHGKPACERLCDAPVAARSADNELASALAGFWLAPAPLPTIALRAVEPAGRDAPPGVALHVRQAVPVPIAFLRLTL
jgi:hypothetical protein